MRSYEPNWPLSSKNMALVSVLAAFTISVFCEGRLTNGQRASSDMTLASVIEKRAGHAIHTPRLIHRNRAKDLTLDQLPYELPAVMVTPIESIVSAKDQA